MPQKPCKFGVKVWILAEAKTGYVLDFQIYTGAASPGDENSSKGLAYQVVMNLMEPYQGKGGTNCLWIIFTPRLTWYVIF